MHIPDGYLGPETYGGLWAVAAPLWYWASRNLKKTLAVSEVPLLALGAALSFILMMFNFPIIGGTSGHATGAVLLSIVLGPWAAFLALSIALTVQALAFGDGGITSLGANCMNMGFAGVFSGYLLYRLLLKGNASNRRIVIAAGAAGYFGINVAALLTAVELGIQPLISAAPDGRPLYNPFPLSVTVPAIMLGHLTVFGFVEAAFTSIAVAYLLKAHPGLIKR